MSVLDPSGCCGAYTITFDNHTTSHAYYYYDCGKTLRETDSTVPFDDCYGDCPNPKDCQSKNSLLWLWICMGVGTLLCVTLCIWSKIRHRRRRYKENMERNERDALALKYYQSVPI